MKDYETEGITEEDNEAYLAMLATTDPIYFEDVVKSMTWRRAMDIEMEAINNNDTWELKSYLKEHRKLK
jgi:hypothetical protein